MAPPGTSRVNYDKPFIQFLLLQNSVKLKFDKIQRFKENAIKVHELELLQKKLNLLEHFTVLLKYLDVFRFT